MDIAIPTLEQVLAKVDAFLARHDMAESRLGRDATGESSLITSMRAGRHPSLKTLNRLDSFMADHDARATSEGGAGSPGKAAEISATLRHGSEQALRQAQGGTLAVCSLCERLAADPATASCTERDCGLRQREVA